MLKSFQKVGLGMVLALVTSGLLAATVTPPTSHGDATAGQKVYAGTCIACHGPTGKGLIPGMPDFTQPNGVLSLSDTVLLGRITNGYDGGNAPMPMPPKGGNSALTPTDLQNALAYLHAKFGHH